MIAVAGHPAFARPAAMERSVKRVEAWTTGLTSKRSRKLADAGRAR